MDAMATAIIIYTKLTYKKIAQIMKDKQLKVSAPQSKSPFQNFEETLWRIPPPPPPLSLSPLYGQGLKVFKYIRNGTLLIILFLIDTIIDVVKSKEKIYMSH